MKTKNKVLLVYISTFFGIIIWLAAILLAPYLRSQSLNLNDLIYAVFSSICHQIPSRCFSVFGHPLAVCVRCFGIYFGFLIGTLIYPFIRGFSLVSVPKTRTFILVSLPIVVDTAGNIFSLWMTSNWLRFFFGFIWGVILPFYFISGISDAFITQKHVSISKTPNKKR